MCGEQATTSTPAHRNLLSARPVAGCGISSTAAAQMRTIRFRVSISQCLLCREVPFPCSLAGIDAKSSYAKATPRPLAVILRKMFLFSVLFSGFSCASRSKYRSHRLSIYDMSPYTNTRNGVSVLGGLYTIRCPNGPVAYDNSPPFRTAWSFFRPSRYVMGIPDGVPSNTLRRSRQIARLRLRSTKSNDET